MNLSMFTFVTFVAILFTPLVAHASYHDVCGTVFFEDSRSNRSDESGSKLTGDGGDTEKVPRLGIYLIDEDGSCQDYDPLCSESDDDLLGFTYTGAGTNTKGDFCFEDIGNLEDIYLITYYASDDSQVWAETGAQPVAFSYPVHEDFGTGHGSPVYLMNWNISCPPIVPGFCDEAFAETYYPLEHAFANTIVAAVDVDYLISNDSLYHPNGHTGPIRLFYPEDPYGECDGSGSEAVDCTYLCIGESDYEENHSVAHEIGHVLQMRSLDVCGSQLHDCGGSHLYDSVENEKCATGEGWANFVAAATYFLPSAWEAYYIGEGWRMEGDTNWGENAPYFRPCYSNDSAPHRREGNVSRFFWDLYDTQTYHDDGNDNTTLSFDTLLATWDEFPSGTINRRANESGDHGRNAYDFAYYEPSAYSELSQNCLGSQETN